MRTLFLLFCLSVLPVSVADALSLLPGDLVVSGTGADGRSGLIRIDSETGEQTMIAEGGFGDFQIVGLDTAYALEGNSVVRINTVTGQRHTVSSGGLITGGAGLAATADGGVFVLNSKRSGQDRINSLIRVDAHTGKQSLFSSGSLFDGLTLGAEDLELGSDDRLVVMGGARFAAVDVFEVDVFSGQATSVFDIGDVSGGFAGIGATGLFVDSAGGIYTLDGQVQSASLIFYDAEAGGADVIGSNLVFSPACFQSPPDDYPQCFAAELFQSDLVVDGRGNLWMVGDTTPTNPAPMLPDGLYKNNRAEDGFTAFSAGHFNEIQLVAGTPVPEPGAAMLFGAGSLLVAWRVRRANLSLGA